MTETPNDNAHLPASLKDEAISWFVRRRGENAAIHEDAFTAWYRASPLHQRAYAWAERHFADAAAVKMSARHGTRREDPRRHGWFNGRTGLALAATLALIIGVSAYLVVSGRTLPTASPGIALTTKSGQIRAFALPDGSRVTLDTDSRARFGVDDRERTFTLEAGRARIAIAPGTQPFVASAASGQVTSGQGVLDMAFDGAARVHVALLDGRAALAAARASTAYVRPGYALIKGQTTSYSAIRFDPAPVPRSDVDDHDWPQGWLDFRAIPLSVLVARTNRYGPPVIVLGDPRLGALRVSGRFRVTDPARIANRVAEVFDLSITRQAGSIRLDEK